MEKVKSNLLLTLFAVLLATLSAILFIVFAPSTAKADIVESPEEELSPSIVCVFEVTSENTVVDFYNLSDLSLVDWGDNTINNLNEHIYANEGSYTCKLYGVTRIGTSAFRNSRVLRQISIFSGVESIGRTAFYHCSLLESVYMSNSVLTIAEMAFDTCVSLIDIEIPDSVVSIGYDAFFNCGNLQSITFGSNVAEIGIKVFDGCDHLNNITVQASNPPMWGDGYLPDLVEHIYVNSESIELYKTAEFWASHADIIEPLPNENTDEPDNPTPNDPTPGTNFNSHSHSSGSSGTSDTFIKVISVTALLTAVVVLLSLPSLGKKNKNRKK